MLQPLLHVLHYMTLLHDVLLQEQLLVRTIRHEIVRPWSEQGELVHCAFGMLATCGVGVEVYCMYLRGMYSILICHFDYIQHEPFQKWIS